MGAAPKKQHDPLFAQEMRCAIARWISDATLDLHDIGCDPLELRWRAEDDMDHGDEVPEDDDCDDLNPFAEGTRTGDEPRTAEPTVHEPPPEPVWRITWGRDTK
jgi:hypothetical protein